MKKPGPSSNNKLGSEHSTPGVSSKKPPSQMSKSTKPRSEEEIKDFSQDINTYINYEDGSTMGSNGESVLVTVRIRPMNATELSRGDEYCLKVFNNRELQIHEKGTQKLYQYNTVLQETTSQDEVFDRCSITEFLASALEGYSATIFAYGQTGSGKTYTMAGVEEKLGREIYVSDETEGIIPRAVRKLWEIMAQREDQFYVKASFTEIYNEQLRDLLNPSSGILHCRWNVKNGFFVEDLMIVECTNVEDMVAVLHEGMKNRKQGSHELNKDSSRSHSILTIYVISEIKNEGNSIKRYGKISFVDLAGSERLKETKSQGEMVKECGNINKSLFTLGKVISGLSDKKNKMPYIPYRDSKLTMLLMDSLGGSSKALMIACISPSAAYFEETLSTLKYAARTMNIKNKPIIQMDAKDQIIHNLNTEIELLKVENQYLKEQLMRMNQGKPIEFLDHLPTPTPNSKHKTLPPLKASAKEKEKGEQNAEIPINKIITEYQFEIHRLINENNELKAAQEVVERNYCTLVTDNTNIQNKLKNLEQVFLNDDDHKNNGKNISEEYMTANIVNENSQLKLKINNLEEKKKHMEDMIEKQANQKSTMKNVETMNKILHLQQTNNQLQDRVEFLQKRERDLLETLMKAQKRR